jgi:hypothetical protein
MSLTREGALLKRLLITVTLSLATFLLFSSPGGAQSSFVRAVPLKVTATTTPKRERFAPYTFTTRGRVVPPTGYCAPGASPRPGEKNCIPILCPPGATDPRYCLLPGPDVICSGVVTVRFQKRGTTTTISSRNVFLRHDCTYRSRVTFRTRLRTRVGILNVRARFQGNAVLAPKTSATHTVRIG